MQTVRPSDPRFLMRAGYVSALFWFEVWAQILDDLCATGDRREG